MGLLVGSVKEDFRKVVEMYAYELITFVECWVIWQTDE